MSASRFLPRVVHVGHPDGCRIGMELHILEAVSEPGQERVYLAAVTGPEASAAAELWERRAPSGAECSVEIMKTQTMKMRLYSRCYLVHEDVVKQFCTLGFADGSSEELAGEFGIARTAGPGSRIEHVGPCIVTAAVIFARALQLAEGGWSVI